MEKKRFHATMSRKRHELIDSAVAAKAEGRTPDKLDAEMRIRFLIRLRQQVLSESAPLPDQTLFISYSKNTGQPFLEVAEKLAISYGFKVITGFQDRQKPNVLRVVRDAIENAAVFLSIMTPEYSIQSLVGDREMRTAPSVWLMEEKGMALALQKPFRLLVEESVHSDFWKRTTPESLHAIFKPIDFEREAEEAIRYLVLRYDEALRASLEGADLEIR